MRHLFFHLAGVLILLAALWQPAGAAEFKPELGQTKEIIAGREVEHTTIPDNAQDLSVYPIPEAHPRQILTELPGQPFRPESPMPLARAWWKYPLYTVVGLPRDLIDALAGGLNFVPLVNIPLVMGAYELVPTQYLMRDPRDWHEWPGLRMNARGHGPHDGGSWGWFPSLHSWEFTYPSQTLARQNEIFNKDLKARLDAKNLEIETENTKQEARLRDARTRALAAIEAGNGREAALRMIAYRHSYPLDEGGFALFTTAMALYVPEGPDWVAPVLWSELENAQPRLLAEAEKLLANTARQHPDRAAVGEALIYARLTLGRTPAALAAAQALLKGKPGDPYRQRLVFETALEAQDQPAAEAARAGMSPNSYDAPTRQLMDIRLKLLAGDEGSLAEVLASLQGLHPEDPYYAYYLGCAKVLAAQKLENPAATYKEAAVLMNRASDLPASPAMHRRIESTRTWVQSVLSGISTNPELFAETGATSGTVAAAVKPPAAAKAAKEPKTGTLPKAKTGTAKPKSKSKK